MQIGMVVAKTSPAAESRLFEMARVLVVDDDVASRLTLQTVLQAGGYSVDVAASAAEAVDKLDASEYELVLSDLRMESPEAGRKVLAHARLKEYRPATAIITAHRGMQRRRAADSGGGSHEMFVEPEDVPSLLEKVASLIGVRVQRQLRRSMRLAQT